MKSSESAEHMRRLSEAGLSASELNGALIRPGVSPTGHPVDVMLAMGFTISPEDEARLRALCDEPVELSEGTK